MDEAEKIDRGGFQAYAALLLGGDSAEPRALSRIKAEKTGFGYGCSDGS